MMSGNDELMMTGLASVAVLAGPGRRRRWSGETKAQIVAESYEASVAEVAERYSLAKTQVFEWRRRARSDPGPLGFAQVEINDRVQYRAVIELVVGSAVLRVPPGADPHLATAMVAALRSCR